MVDKKEIRELMKKMVLHLNNVVTSRQKVRILGGLESLLILVCELPSSGPLPYKNIKVEVTNFWGKTSIVTEKETYKELIMRKVGNFI